MTNEKSDSKTNGIFELIMVENLTRSINGYSAYGTVHILGNIHKYNTVSHIQYDEVALTDDVAGCYWTKILMWY